MLVRIVVFSSDGRAINVEEINNVSNFLRSPYPAFVIYGVRFRGGNVTNSTSRGLEIIFMQVAQVAMHARALVAHVIVVTSAAPPPATTTLSAGVIITLTYRLTVSNSTFRRSLHRHCADQGLVGLRLLRDRVAVLVCVFCMAKVSSLHLHSCYGRRGRDWGSRSVRFILRFVSSISCGTRGSRGWLKLSVSFLALWRWL